MRIEIDKRRWLHRQSTVVQVIFWFIIFFFSDIMGQLVADLLFGDPAFYKGSAKEIEVFLIKDGVLSLLWSLAFVYFLKGYKKRALKKSLIEERS